MQTLATAIAFNELDDVDHVCLKQPCVFCSVRSGKAHDSTRDDMISEILRLVQAMPDDDVEALRLVIVGMSAHKKPAKVRDTRSERPALRLASSS